MVWKVSEMKWKDNRIVKERYFQPFVGGFKVEDMVGRMVVL